MLTVKLPIGHVDVVNGVCRTEKTQKSNLEIRNSKQIEMIKKVDYDNNDKDDSAAARRISSRTLVRPGLAGAVHRRRGGVRARSDRATLIATSDPEEAYEVADRILTMDHHVLRPIAGNKTISAAIEGISA